MLNSLTSKMPHFLSPPQSKPTDGAPSDQLYHAPKHYEINIGELDWQSNPDNVLALATLMAHALLDFDACVSTCLHMSIRFFVAGERVLLSIVMAHITREKEPSENVTSVTSDVLYA